MSRSDRIYIAVDPSKVARCQWCGSAESRNWVSTRDGLYCSGECKAADDAVGKLGACVFGQVMALIVVPMFNTPFSPDGFVVPLLMVEGVSFLLLCSSCRGWGWRSQVPRNSRSDDAALDLALLTGIAAGVQCPRCGANLDLRKVSSNMVYRCDYCGASGHVELIKTQH